MLVVNKFLHENHKKNLGLRRQLSQDHAVKITGLVLLASLLILISLDVFVRIIYNVDQENVPYIYKLVSIGKDNSFPEVFNHSLLFLASVLFFATSISKNSRVCFALAGFMAIAWFDDSTQYHERFGWEFSKLFPNLNVGGLGSSHIGELLAWGTIGIVLLSLVFWASKNILDGDRNIIKMVYLPIFLMILCASLVDVVHSSLSGSKFDAVFMYLEDGGEMIATVMLATLSLYVIRNENEIFNDKG